MRDTSAVFPSSQDERKSLFRTVVGVFVSVRSGPRKKATSPLEETAAQAVSPPPSATSVECMQLDEGANDGIPLILTPTMHLIVPLENLHQQSSGACLHV